MRFLAGLVGRVDVAVDVGAAEGSYAWILNRVARKVYAFEPGAAHYQFLRRMVFASRIEVVRAAVGRVEGRASLYTPGEGREALHSATLSSSNPAIDAEGTRSETVDVVTLDSFLGRALHSADSVDVLKIDVEGFELDVLEGAVETLSRHHPLIVCEIEARHNSAYGRVFDLLRKQEYTPFFFRAGSVRRLRDERIGLLQAKSDLEVRLQSGYDPVSNAYVNNFVFQHPQSRVKVST